MPQSIIPAPMAVSPYLKRWMLFVDGENLTIRAQEFAKKRSLSLKQGKYYRRDVFIWMPYKGIEAGDISPTTDILLQPRPIRGYYFTSMVGEDDLLRNTKEAIWDLEFQPKVFKRMQGRAKAKGVDVALTTEVLSNAFQDNYDVAVLAAGDGDYIPLVEEVKRLGKIVYILFFSEQGIGLHPDLKLASDYFIPLDDPFETSWIPYSNSGG